MNYSTILPYLKSVAPTIAKYLSLTDLPGSGIAASLLSAAFGTSESTPEQVCQKVLTDPDAAIKLKKLEDDHAEALEQLAIDQAKVSLLAQKPKWVLSIAIIPLIIATIFGLLMIHDKDVHHVLVGLLVGLSTALLHIYASGSSGFGFF